MGVHDLLVVCPGCDGSGVVETSDWVVFHEELKRFAITHDLSLGDAWSILESQAPEVGEERVCPRCAGHGCLPTKEGMAWYLALKRLIAVCDDLAGEEVCHDSRC